MPRDKKPVNGISVLHKDSCCRKLQDLDGKVSGFPSPNAFGAALYMRALPPDANPIKFAPRYLNNPVFEHVALGQVAAGGTVNSACHDETPELRDQLTVLFQAPDIASHPVVAHPRVPAGVRKSAVAAIMAQQQDIEGRAMLKQIRFPNPVDANYQSEISRSRNSICRSIWARKLRTCLCGTVTNSA